MTRKMKTFYEKGVLWLLVSSWQVDLGVCRATNNECSTHSHPSLPMLLKKDLLQQGLQQYKNIGRCLITCSRGVEDPTREIGTLPIGKKAKPSFRVVPWNFSVYPKLILKNHQGLCLKSLGFQTVAWGQGQSLLISTAVLAMPTTTLWKGSLFCNEGEDMNCCFTSKED